MTIEPTFTYSEKSHIERLRPGNSGSSEDQFIQEVIDFYRYWQSKRSLGDYGSTEQALLMILRKRRTSIWDLKTMSQQRSHA